MSSLPRKRKEPDDANTAAAIGLRPLSDNSHLGGRWFPPATSDLSFVCNGHDFRVHKAVVLRHSAVIRAAVEGNFVEARTNTVSMDGFQPLTVRSLVDFMYRNVYPWRREAYPDVASVPARAPATERIMEHVRVNSIADYYDIAPLVRLANHKIRAIVLSPPGAEADRSWVPDIVPIVQAAVRMTGDESLLHVLAAGFSLDPGTLADPGRLRHLEAVPAFCTHVIQACILNYRHGMSAKGMIMRDQELVINRHRNGLSMLNRTDSCVGCNVRFPCILRPDEFSLHCLDCGHVHAPAPAARP